MKGLRSLSLHFIEICNDNPRLVLLADTFHSISQPKYSRPPTFGPLSSPVYRECASMAIAMTFNQSRSFCESITSPSPPRTEVRSGTVQMTSDSLPSSSAYAAYKNSFRNGIAKDGHPEPAIHLGDYDSTRWLSKTSDKLFSWCCTGHLPD